MARTTTVRRTSATEAGFALELARTFDAPRERVWAAWTDPARLARWWGPEEFTCAHCEMDVRPGGAWRTCMVSPQGIEHWVSGVYTEVDPPARLAFTWAWETHDARGVTRREETLVSIALRDGGSGTTELVLTQASFAEAADCDDHGDGWTSSLNDLERFLAAG